MGYNGISHCFLDQYDESLEILERGVGLYPDDYYLKNSLAMTYYDLGEYEKSLEMCEEGLKIRDYDWLYENKLKALIRLDRINEAVEFARTAPVSADLGIILFDEGRIDDALDYYHLLLRENPDDIWAAESIKLITCQCGLDKTLDVGDYYLKWIDNIKDAGISSGCGEFSIECISLECDDNRLEEYVRFKIFELTSAFRLSDCVGEDKIRKVLCTLDDVEFEAFLTRLEEIGYIERNGNHVKITSDIKEKLS